MGELHIEWIDKVQSGKIFEIFFVARDQGEIAQYRRGRYDCICYLYLRSFLISIVFFTISSVSGKMVRLRTNISAFASWIVSGN